MNPTIFLNGLPLAKAQLLALRTLALGLLVALFASPGVLAQSDPYSFTASRVLAFGDVHGEYQGLVKLLQANGVVDEQQHWAAGTAHLVSLGDLVDRGPDSRRVMDLLRRLETQAATAGGRVHVLLGNHEAMNLTGDLRDVSDAEFAAFAQGASSKPEPEDSPPGVEAGLQVDSLVASQPLGFQQHREAFSAAGEYGKWLLALPSIIRINRTAFVHGGLSPLVAQLGLVATNKQIAAALRANLSSSFQEQAPPEILDAAGPLWYRGTARCHPLIENDVLTPALQQLQVDRVVVGHTPTVAGSITQRLHNRVLAIDTGMLHSVYGGQPWLLEINSSKVQAFDTNAKAYKPQSQVRGLDLGEVTEQELATLLRTEPFAKLKNTPHFDYQLPNGRTVQIDVSATSRRKAAKAEALWQLDRLLGLQLVPVTVARRHSGSWYALSAIQGAWRSESQRQQQKLVRPEFCQRYSELDLFTLFDALTRRQLRHPDTLWYRRGSWQVRLGDVSNSFPTSKKIIPEITSVKIPPALVARLQELTLPLLQARFAKALSQREMLALLQRRDTLLGWQTERTP